MIRPQSYKNAVNNTNLRLKSHIWPQLLALFTNRERNWSEFSVVGLFDYHF